MSHEAKILCHLQQDCGLCSAFEYEFKVFRKDCKCRDEDDCLNLNSKGAVCRVCNCPLFDREQVLKEKEANNGKVREDK